jgi:hypothetical protein
MDIWHTANQIPAAGLRIAWMGLYAVFIGYNTASALGLLGPTNAEISGKFQTALTPAG